MAPDPVQPLRINKSPPKMSPSGVPRPLSEISPMGIRRNSPSFNQSTGKPLNATAQDSSPFEASPVNSSPRLFWKSRDATVPNKRESENSPLRNDSTSPARRSSLEKLKTASRVTNSHMFAREHESDYDPDTSSLIERPLAANRPLSVQVQGNAWMATGLDGMRTETPVSGHRRTESNTDIPTFSHSSSPVKRSSPIKPQLSPQKSSLSSNSRYSSANMFDPEEGTWSDGEGSTRANTPRALRQAKSVTFDNAPPQINEYEMITPDPSSVASGSREGSCDSEPFDMDDAFERPDSPDHDDSFDESLEDADKTPVVLPEDWRFMSPQAANTGLADTFDDPFDSGTGAPSPSTRYRPTPERDTSVARSSSANSAGDCRPLPPLPASLAHQRTGLSRESIPKTIPSSPRPASVSKAEILEMRSSPMPLDERLRLLSLEQDAQAKILQAQKSGNSGSAKDEAPSHAMKAGSKESTSSQEYKPPTRISRESILRNVNPQSFQDLHYGNSSPETHRSLDCEQIDYSNLDPDVPIPSREISSDYGEEVPEIPIKQEDSDDGSLVDMYAFPEDEDNPRSVSPADEFGIESSVIHYDIPRSETPEELETATIQVDARTRNLEAADEASKHLTSEEVTTPKFKGLGTDSAFDSSRMSLPEFTSIFSKDDFDFGLQSYLTPPAQKLREEEPEKKILAQPEIPEFPHTQPTSPKTVDDNAKKIIDFEQRPATPLENIIVGPHLSQDSLGGNISTPESVIHNPIDEDRSRPESSPVVPAPEATIKAPGTKLKTRLSATPADIQMMSATRRQISVEQPAPIPEQQDNSVLEDSLAVSDNSEHDNAAHDKFASENTRQSLNVKLDVPLLSGADELGLGLGEEFDRLLEAKKKGYLMRQNTKLVVASNRQPGEDNSIEETASAKVPELSAESSQTETAPGTRSAGASPHKPSKTWTTEPWNGRMRRQSTRRSNIVPDKRLPSGPAPPMPGHESNVTDAMETVAEDQIEPQLDDYDDSGERGRLFVKVVGVKELDLPLPNNERCYFQMTLDNGLHCVTTSWAELGRTSPIGQEFELVVFDDLEFQLTLQTKLERPKSATSSMQSFTPSLNSKKPSALSRMFTSPKKRRELEKKQRDEEAQAALQREQELEAQRNSRQPTAWDLQNELVGPDGSFARAYVCLSNHERQAYGRPYSVDVPCWNEWAVEEKSIASTRSKTGGVQRRPPYRIGKMELQLMYIPRPRNATDEEMPKSMSAAVRLLKEAEAVATRQFEGHLSQQGGDCPFWRRRFFKLNGSKLTAYHDMTRQPRATISLAKATKLIDDKSSLTQLDPGSPVKSKGRRKSAFAEEEEGYMFVEEGFRIRFANGEVIDFYADNSADKEKWMRVLSLAVGKENPEEKKTWTSLVLAKERVAGTATAKATAKTLAVGAKGHQLTDKNAPLRNTSKSAPTSPQKSSAKVAAGNVQGTSGAADLKENKPAPAMKAPAKPSQQSTTSKLSSPTKQPVSSAKQTTASLAKQTTASPIKEQKSPSKRSSAGVAPMLSPRKQTKEIAEKRQGVRSMIF